MASTTRTDRRILAGLLVLFAVPLSIGVVRLLDLASGGPVAPGNARFHAAPLPIAIHVLSSAVYAILGALQFTSGSPARRRGWHKAAGKIAVAAGFGAAGSGIALTLTYPDADFSGPALFAMRLAAGAGMIAFLLLGLRAIPRGDFPAHRDWMIRAYALGAAAGTQFFTHLPFLFFPSIRGEAVRAVMMGLGWAVNILAAEALIRRIRSGPGGPGRAHDPAPPAGSGSPARIGGPTMIGMALLLAQPIQAQPSWKTETSRDGKVEVASRVYDLAADGGKPVQLVEYSATTIARAPLERCIALLMDASRHKDFLGDEISRRVATLSDSEWVLYYYSAAPWPFSDFDCVTRMRYAREPGKGLARFELTAAPALYPPGEVKRISRYDVVYAFEDLGEKGTRISMVGAVAPTVKAPAWMISANFPEGPADVLLKIAKLAGG